ncbi:hypothetical protein [Actinomycetospora sp. TBRC 11914]|uniref:hypothetical protein n=1 Tax=Actinomycetospora sp. TBRC 11914 TaxID=2729387 RepID=UPI00145C77D1|nr:hypothetical protein [Actinomycetospora sp. TBRC 11914]NMO91054.1 hypothetical protein [Actinomycetospora sp. TBRC 11914]
MDEIEVWPDGLPVPSRNCHRSVEVGACVMEYAALLGGEAHTDHPRSVHPLLAELSRRANDVVGDEARAALVLLVPALIGTAGAADPDADPDAASRAVADVLRRHLEGDGAPLAPRPRLPVPDRVDPGVGGGTAVLDRPAAESHGEQQAWIDRAFERSCTTRRNDREVVELLEAMVHEVRAARGLPPVATGGPSSSA